MPPTQFASSDHSTVDRCPTACNDHPSIGREAKLAAYISSLLPDGFTPGAKLRGLFGSPRKLVGSQSLYLQGFAKERLYIVDQGWLLGQQLLPDGRRQVLRVFSPGDIIGLTDYQASIAVCRQGFWNQWRLKLIEGLAHLFGLIMRRAGGDASGALRASFV